MAPLKRTAGGLPGRMCRNRSFPEATLVSATPPAHGIQHGEVSVSCGMGDLHVDNLGAAYQGDPDANSQHNYRDRGAAGNNSCGSISRRDGPLGGG